ncbi:Glycosyltransferase involved in cell wall bisynthesis [Sphingobium faniae]|nr:Glycosyltransferase involved in cell wall bisynthesis [Sphingobium faniae]
MPRASHMHGMTTCFADMRASAFHQSGCAVALRGALGRPLRVALFSGNYDCVRDGANQALNRLVAYLLNRVGAQVRIYSPTAPRKAFESVGDIHSVRSLSIPGRPEYRLALGLTRAARCDLEAFAPDVIHLSAPDLLGRQAQKHARRQGIPVVASLHTRFETYLDYYRLSVLRPMIMRYLDRFYGESDRILAPTPPIARDMAARIGGEKVGIWGRGVDPASFRPGLRDDGFRSAHGYAAEDVVPLFFGRLVLEKGLGVFVEAVAEIRARGHAVRPLIVGEGPARGWLAERMPNATFMGHLAGEVLGRAVASADLLINPSVTEAFGNVNLEAMASGLAVISADVSSASALISHGRTGLLVPAAQVNGYVDAAIGLMMDRGRRLAIGAAAAAEASRHRWEDVLEDVAGAYCHILQIPLAAQMERAA